MKREFALLLALCACAAAMVPRERRAVETEAVETEDSKKICAPTTPCGWAVYNTHNKAVTIEVPNTYCVCAEDSTCEEFEDDPAANSWIKRCKKT